MEKPSSLTEAIFGIPSDINVYPEITHGFLERGEYGIDAFRIYIRELSYSDEKFEEILLRIYREVKRRCMEDPRYEELLAAVCSGIGTFYLDMGYEGAERLLLEAFNLRSKLYGTERAFLLANTMSKLGIFYIQNGKPEKAEVMFEDAHTIMKDLYEQSEEFELDYVLMTINLGTFYFEVGRAEEGLKFQLEALKHRDVLPCGGAIPYFNIALCYQDLRDYERAVEYYVKASAVAIDRGFVDVKEALSRALEITSLNFVCSKIKELFERGEICDREFEMLMGILRCWYV